jgi:ornithine cyclodeaminase/alanine dehydrogenase-like protein (mu-crystallin family)
VPLYLCEEDVAALVSPADAAVAVEGCFFQIARGAAAGSDRVRAGLDDGALEAAAAVDREAGVAGAEAAVSVAGDRSAVVLLFAGDRAELVAVVEAELLERLSAGGTTAVAARHLAHGGARTLGVIGAGRHAEAQIAALRGELPELERVVVYARRAPELRAFCERVGAEPAEYNRDAAEQDVVVTATSTRDPVLRGEWLRPGALVCALGATVLDARELDNAVVERASFVCCESREHAMVEAGDLAEPVARGVLDWLEVHELSEVVAGEVRGRAADTDIVLFKSVGIAAARLAVASLAVRRAAELGRGRRLA